MSIKNLELVILEETKERKLKDLKRKRAELNEIKSDIRNIDLKIKAEMTKLESNIYNNMEM